MPWWELAANASRFEVGSSKPDDAFARATWIAWAACAALSTLSAGTVATAVLRCRKARSSIFNIYLACLLSVEAHMSLSVVITCLMNVANGGYVGRAMCEYQSFYMAFAAGSAFYLNLLIAYEVFRLLSATKRLESYIPPTRRRAVLRCIGIMLPCALGSSMSSWRVLPHEARLLRGMICFPAGSGTVGRLSVLFLPVMFPLYIFLPTVLLLALALVSWRRKLFDFSIQRIARASDSDDLHAQAAHRHRLQQARMITLYFGRILVVLLLWYPAFGLSVSTIHSPLVVTIGLPFVFLQSAVSSCMSLTKTDVREAVIGLLGKRLACMCARTSRVTPWQQSPPQQTGFEPKPKTQLRPAAIIRQVRLLEAHMHVPSLHTSPPEAKSSPTKRNPPPTPPPSTPQHPSA